VVVLINWIEAGIGNQNLDCCATSAVEFVLVVELKALQAWMLMECLINCFCFTFIVGFEF
jgi:hypothetical protein